jgi:hypothetical protein
MSASIIAAKSESIGQSAHFSVIVPFPPCGVDRAIVVVRSPLIFIHIFHLP